MAHSYDDGHLDGIKSPPAEIESPQESFVDDNVVPAISSVNIPHYTGDIGLLFEKLLIRRERLRLNVLRDGKLDSDVLEPPTAKIKSISSDGVVEILFSNPMVVHPALLNLTSDGLPIADYLRED